MALGLLIVPTVLIAIALLAIYLTRAGIVRRSVIRIVEFLGVILVLVFSIAGALVGRHLFYLFSHNVNASMVPFFRLPVGEIVSLSFGALFGFMLSASMLALLFLLVDISNNTKKMIELFENITMRERQ